MDSVANGEILDECLANAEESSNMHTSDKCSSEMKNLHELGENCKGELPKSEVSHSDDAMSLKMAGTLTVISEDTSVGKNKDLELGSAISAKPCSSPSNEDIKSSKNKENGLTVDTKVEEMHGNMKPKSENLPQAQKKNYTVGAHKVSTETDIKNKISILETILPDDGNSISSEELTMKENKYIDYSISNNCIPNSNKKEADTSSNVVAVSSDKAEIKDNSVESTEANVSKNHFMSGGSIVKSNDNQDADQKLDPDKCTNIGDGEKLSSIISHTPKSFDISESVPIVNMTESVEQPLNFASRKMEQLASLSKAKLPHENGFNELNPLQKLNEHLKSIGNETEQLPLYNHTPKGDISDLNSTLLTPILVSHKTDVHACSDKENRCLDSSHSHDRLSKDPPDSFVFSELSNEETGFPEAFTGLVKIGKYISVKGDFTLRSTEALVESPSLVAPYLLKEPDSFPPKEKDSSKPEIKDFFHSAAGEVLIGIGLSRVNEWFRRDMVRIKKRQMKKNGKTAQLEEELSMHEKCFEEAKKANNVYSFSVEVCKTCGFTTESSIVMEGHLLVPHITQRREYQCNFCDVINRDPKLMLEHMEKVHRKVGRIQPPVLFFECPYCTFEN